jgi:membrane dipeptidase
MKPATKMTPEERSAMRDQINAIRRQYPDPLATVVDVVDHIDHMVSVAGIDHIGIGCDFDGGGGIDGVFDVSEVANITIELVRRGYSEEDIRKVWGGNLLRVFKDVQAVAANWEA